MSTAPFFSIIIPVYNVASYLDRCFDSLFSLMYSSSYEIIAIDDCSTDDSFQYLKDYDKKDSRIRIFHHDENQGVSVARNTGLMHAKGMYVLFIDPDDCFHPQTLKILDAILSSNDQTDIIHFSTKIFSDGRATKKWLEDDKLKDLHGKSFDLSKELDFKNGFEGTACNMTACTSVVHRSIYTKMRFKSYSNGEDIIWGVETFLKAKIMIQLPLSLYGYCFREGSASKSMTSRHCQSVMDVSKIVSLICMSDSRAKIIQPILMRKIRPMLHGTAIRQLLALSFEERNVLWKQWWDINHDTFLPLVSKPLLSWYYRILLKMRIPFVAYVFFYWPILLKGRLLKLPLMMILLQSIRKHLSR